MSLIRVNPGQPITSEHHNQLCDAIEKIAGLSPGEDFQVRFSALGATLDLIRKGWQSLVPARITGAPTASTIPEEECKYTVQAYGNSDWILDGVRPNYARPLRGPDVMMVPGAVDDFCFMIRSHEGDGKYKTDAWILTESYVVAKCNPSPGALRNPLLDSVIPVPPSTTNSTPASAGDDGAVPAGE